MPHSESFSVDRVAELARLRMPSSPEQVEAEIGKILEFINVLDELDLENVEPFFGVKPTDADEPHRTQRPDQRTESYSRDEVLKNAPSQDGEFYRVPPVF